MDLFYLTTLQGRIKDDEQTINRACNVAKRRIMPLLTKHGIADADLGLHGIEQWVLC